MDEHRATKEDRAKWRALSLVLLGVLVGGVLLSPVSAHIGTPLHLWKKHIKPKADKRYVGNQGRILIGHSWHDWVLTEPDVGASLIYHNAAAQLEAAGATPNPAKAALGGTPTTLYGKKTRLKGAELCYDARDANLTLTQVRLEVYTNTSMAGQSPSATFEDQTDRNDETCRMYSMDPPVLMTGEDLVNMTVSVDFSGAGTFAIGRTTFILEATKQGAPPLS